MRRAQRAGVSPDQFAQQVVQGGQLPVLVSEVRRGKALATVMEAPTIVDSGRRDRSTSRRCATTARPAPDVEVDEDGRPFHVHDDGAVHYLDEQ